MTPEEFRKHGYQVIDWIADYLQNVERYPVLSQVAPGEIRRQAAGCSTRVMGSRSTRCCVTWTTSSCRALPTGSRRTSSLSFRPITPAPPFSATYCRRGWESRG